MRQVGLAVFAVGQRQVGQRRLLAGDDLHERLRAVQQRAAQLGKTHITPAGDHMVGQMRDGLLFGLMAHLRPAQHQFEVGPRRLEQTDHLGGLCHVPDVHAKAHDLHPGGCFRRRPQRGQQVRHHLLRRPGNRVLTQLGARAQARAAMPVEVGQQITQAQRGVNVARVERDQHDARASDVCHGFGHRTTAPTR